MLGQPVVSQYYWVRTLQLRHIELNLTGVRARKLDWQEHNIIHKVVNSTIYQGKQERRDFLRW